MVVSFPLFLPRVRQLVFYGSYYNVRRSDVFFPYLPLHTDTLPLLPRGGPSRLFFRRRHPIPKVRGSPFRTIYLRHNYGRLSRVHRGHQFRTITTTRLFLGSNGHDPPRFTIQHFSNLRWGLSTTDQELRYGSGLSIFFRSTTRRHRHVYRRFLHQLLLRPNSNFLCFFVSPRPLIPRFNIFFFRGRLRSTNTVHHLQRGR